MVSTPAITDPGPRSLPWLFCWPVAGIGTQPLSIINRSSSHSWVGGNYKGKSSSSRSIQRSGIERKWSKQNKKPGAAHRRPPQARGVETRGDRDMTYIGGDELANKRIEQAAAHAQDILTAPNEQLAPSSRGLADLISDATRRAPLQSLIAAFLLGLVISRRRSPRQ